MFRQRKRDGEQWTPPARVPHHDPAVELQLQRIISMQRIIEGKHAVLDEVNSSLRRLTEKAWPSQYEPRKELRAQAAEMEKEIMGLHESIATAIGELDPSDASYLR